MQIYIVYIVKEISLYTVRIRISDWYGNYFDHLRAWEEDMYNHPQLPIFHISLESLIKVSFEMHNKHYTYMHCFLFIVICHDCRLIIPFEI